MARTRFLVLFSFELRGGGGKGVELFSNRIPNSSFHCIVKTFSFTEKQTAWKKVVIDPIKCWNLVDDDGQLIRSFSTFEHSLSTFVAIRGRYFRY